MQLSFFLLQHSTCEKSESGQSLFSRRKYRKLGEYQKGTSAQKILLLPNETPRPHGAGGTVVTAVAARQPAVHGARYPVGCLPLKE